LRLWGNYSGDLELVFYGIREDGFKDYDSGFIGFYGKDNVLEGNTILFWGNGTGFCGNDKVFDSFNCYLSLLTYPT
jgi:hypothetical protein